MHNDPAPIFETNAARDHMSWTKGTGVGYAKIGENEDYTIDAKASHLRVHAFASGLIAVVAHSTG